MEEPREVQKLVELYRTRRKSTPGNSGVTEEVHETLLAMDQGQVSMVLRRRFQAIALTSSSRNASKEYDLIELLRAIFWAIPSSRKQGEKLRRQVFFSVIQMLMCAPPATAATSTSTTVNDTEALLGISTALANSLVTLLLCEVHYVSIHAIPLLLDEILASITRQVQRERRPQAVTGPGSGSWAIGFPALELMPQLLLRLSRCVSSQEMTSASQSSQESSQTTVGKDYKDAFLDRFVSLPWPQTLVVPVMKAFRDFPFTEVQERSLCCKLFAEINQFIAHTMDLGDAVAGTDGGAGSSGASSTLNGITNTTDVLNLVPTLICHALQLVRKSKSTFCRKILMHCVLKLLAVVTPGPRNTLPAFARARVTKLTGGKDFHGNNNRRIHTQLLHHSYLRELRAVQASILYQLDLMLKQDDVIVTAFLNEFKTRTMQPLSSLEIALLLAAASHLAHQNQVMSFLTNYIILSYVQDYSTRDDGTSSTSCDASTSGGTRVATASSSRRAAFLDAVSFLRECGWEVISEMSVELGFQLFATAKPLSLASGSSASTCSALSVVSSSTSSLSSLWIGFGIRLVLSAFNNYRSIRRNVLDRIVHVVLVQSSSELEPSIRLLARILKRHTVEIDQDMLWKIREALEYIGLLQVGHARALFMALAPLLMLRPDLKDYMILILRKMVFKREPEPRIVGIAGLAFLLTLSSKTLPSRRASLTQLYSQCVEFPGFGSSLSQLPGSSSWSQTTTTCRSSQLLSQQRVNILKSDDLFRQFCGVFKRALHFQTQVRQQLYRELASVFDQCPTIRASVLDLIWTHFAQFYDAQPAIGPPLRLDLCLGNAKQGKYVEPLAELLHLLVKICRPNDPENHSPGAADSDDLLMDTTLYIDEEQQVLDNAGVAAAASGGSSVRIQQVSDCLKSLVYRLKRCELEDFDLDKTSSFDAEDPLGQSNVQLAGLLLGIWEVCMDYLATGSPLAKNTSQTLPGDDGDWDSMASVVVVSWQTIKPDVLRFFRLYCQLCDRMERQQAQSSANKSKVKAKSNTKPNNATLLATLKRRRKTSGNKWMESKSQRDTLAGSCFYQVHKTLLLSVPSVVCLLRGVCMEISTSSANTPDDETRRLAVFLLTKASQVVHKWIQDMADHDATIDTDANVGGGNANQSSLEDATRRVSFDVSCTVVSVDDTHQHIQEIAALSLRMFWWTRWQPPTNVGSDGMVPAKRGRKKGKTTLTTTDANHGADAETPQEAMPTMSTNVNAEALHIFSMLVEYLCSHQKNSSSMTLVPWMTSVFNEANLGESLEAATSTFAGSDATEPSHDMENDPLPTTQRAMNNSSVCRDLCSCLGLLRNKLDTIIPQKRTLESNLLLQVIHHLLLVAMDENRAILKSYVKWMERLVEQRQVQCPLLLEKCIELALCWHRLAQSSAFLFSNGLAIGLVFFCNGHESSSGFAHIDEAKHFVQLDGLEEKKVLVIAGALLNEVEFGLLDAERRMKTWKQAQAMKTTKRTALKEQEQLLLAQLEMETRFCIHRFGAGEEEDTDEIQASDELPRASHLRPMPVHQVQAAQTLEEEDALLSEKLYGLCTLLLPFVLIDLNKPTLSNRIMRLVIRTYKLLVVYVNAKVRKKTTACWNGALEKLIHRSAAQLTPSILHYIACIHEENKRHAIAAAASLAKTNKKRKTNSTSATTATTEPLGTVTTSKASNSSSSSSSGGGGGGAASVQSRVIPDAIFQLEQYDVALIRLSKLFPEKDFSTCCQLRQSRDFRFNRDRLEASIGAPLQPQEQHNEEEQEDEQADEPDQEVLGHESDADNGELQEDGAAHGEEEEEEEEEVLEEEEEEEVELTATAPHADDEQEPQEIPANHDSSADSQDTQSA